jgi:NADP-dependent 3-hydroxy acid dehydrogenase YdfG
VRDWRPRALRIGAALPQMKAPCSGHIINVRSVAGHVVRPGSAVHAATKTAVREISKRLRQEVKPYNIRTTAISPGGHRTARRRDRAGRGAEPLCEGYQRVAIPAESFANTVIFAISQPADVKNSKPRQATMAGNGMSANRRLYRCSSIGLAATWGNLAQSRPASMPACALS